LYGPNSRTLDTSVFAPHIDDVAAQTAYSIADGLLQICLTNPITQECLRAMIEPKPQRVVCLDPAFVGNDQLRTNTVLKIESHGSEFRNA